jgi:drug/metabolite transporter (DMT)-like permease
MALAVAGRNRYGMAIMTDLTSPPRRRAIPPELILVLAPLFWSINVTLARGLHDILPPIGLSVARWGLASAIMLAFTGRTVWRQRALFLAHWKLMLLLGLTGVACYNTLAYAALQLTPAINLVIINSTASMFTALFAWMLLGLRPSGRQGIGIGISMLGALVIVTRGQPALLMGLGHDAGDMLALAATAIWAIYSVLLRRRPPALDPMALLTVTFMIGFVLLLPALAWEISTGRTMSLTPTTVGVVIYVSVFASCLAYWAWSSGVALLGPSTASLYIHLIPVFASILAVIFLGERFAGYHGVGIALIVAGLWWAGALGIRPKPR